MKKNESTGKYPGTFGVYLVLRYGMHGKPHGGAIYISFEVNKIL
jgi:hypothetical protein